MDQVGGIIWDITKCLCGCAKKEADYIYKLEENLESLKDKWKDLQSMKEDLKTRVDEAENTQGMQIAHEIKRWLEKVDNIQQQEMTDIEVQAKEIQDKCLSKCCPKNCKSSYKLGKKAAKMVNNVDNLAAEGKSYSENFIIAHKRPPKPIEMPLDEVVGLDLMFNKVWKSIEEENVGIIGLYGMGGVGKTTLLKKINNEVVKRGLGFDFVMWVVVSKEANLNSIMDNIRKLVGIGDDFWIRNSNPDEKAAKIFGALKQKKFVLLLDDIWDKLNLKLVGVPHPKDTKSKVLFTTRFENVCAQMQVQKKFKVEILIEKEALELFCTKVGEETLNSHPNIPRLAEKMAKECKGLPLALIVLGSSMAGVTSIEVWEDSMMNLTSSSWTAPGLEKEVFSILKYSYDKLDAVQKLCFLYCALYPEDYEILVSDLIDKWMWEEFLCKDMTMSVEHIRSRGESVIEKLKLSCLLESVEDDFFVSRTVKMHDVIRDMALWLLQEDHDHMELVKRISIRDDWESQKSIDPANVTTLVLLGWIHHQLKDIKYMERLKVLELHVEDLAFVDIGGLTSLEYLSFHFQRGSLEPLFWINLKSSTNLKFLSFLGTSPHISTWESPLGVLSSLQQLRVFRLVGNIKINPLKERRILEELECLPKIEELRIIISSRNGLDKLLESARLQSCLYEISTYLSYSDVSNEKPLLSLGSMLGLKKLQEISLFDINIRSDQYPFMLETCWLAKLRKVQITSCQVTHVTWLRYAPLLQLLAIYGCESMEEVIKEEEAIKDEKVDSPPVFSSLVQLLLVELPILKSIHRAPLPFPSLKWVFIHSCPKLEKLPFDSNSAKHKLTHIRGQQNWWDSLKWDDPTAKDKFQSKFKSF
ncbi:hypothetical protein QN277_022574 [Acacia crassicarpa]|uniref:AAA+ ATPase domain-containing protein n=1 Tax=Acacia crassicarpa TaxID=499986 RepID=A0AAE1JJY4_9FABA|nr:hypothetical protein QN277_022574 [Acacia crassicarpa]